MNQFTTSLWGDEAFSAILSMKPIPEIIKISSRDTYPPLYNISEHLWFNFFGTSETAIRSLSFLYFLIAVIFVFLIAKHFWDQKTAFIAAALTFLNPFFFSYAFEGRMYSILAAGVTASMYFFLKKQFWLYIVATTVALYSHHFAFLAVLLQVGWLAYEFLKTKSKRKSLKSMFKALMIIGVFYLPWLAPLYQQVTRVGGGFWLGKPTVSDFWGLVFNYLATGIKHPLAIPALVLTLASLGLRRWQQNLEKSIFLLTWFLGPILITWFISQSFQSIFYNRYLLFTIPAAMLLIASERRRFSTTILILLIGFFSIIDSYFFTHPVKDPFSDLAEYVRETRRGDDYLIIGNPGSHQLWETKYYGIPAPIYNPEDESLPFYVGTALMTEEDIVTSLPPKIYRVGVIYKGSLEDFKLTGYTKTEILKFGNLDFAWYE